MESARRISGFAVLDGKAFMSYDKQVSAKFCITARKSLTGIARKLPNRKPQSRLWRPFDRGIVSLAHTHLDQIDARVCSYGALPSQVLAVNH